MPGPGNTYEKLDDVTDICGIRVITYCAADIDVIAQLLADEFVIDPARSTDRRVYEDPDRFGYKSLHYIVSLSDHRLRLAEYATFAGYVAEI